jgi:antitoxin ParD1/3/4
MSTFNIKVSVTEDLKSFVDARMLAKGFSSVSEYVRDLVRRDIERRDEERFVALIKEGMASGPAGTWNELRGKFTQESASQRDLNTTVAKKRALKSS